MLLLKQWELLDVPEVPPFVEQEVILAIDHELGLGKYKARAKAFDGGKELDSEFLAFRVVLPEELVKEGRLVDAYTKSVVAPGEVVKITGLFENTGGAVLTPMLQAEISNNKRLIEVVKGEGQRVRPGQKSELHAYFTPESVGEYEATVWTSFAGSQSERKQVMFTVDAERTSQTTIVGVVVLTLLVIVGFSYRKVFKSLLSRKRK